MDILGCLPPEISQQVLLCLDSKDIEVVFNGIEEWNHLFDNFFWNKLCHKYGYQEEEACLCSDIYKEAILKHSFHWEIYFNFQEKNAIRKMIKHQNLLIYFMSKTLKILNLETKSLVLNLKLEVFTVFYFEEIHMEVYNNLLAVLNSPRFFGVINLETKKLNVKVLGVVDGCFGDNIIMTVLYGHQLIVHDLNGKPLMNIAYGEGLHVENIMTKGGYVIISYYSEIAGQRFPKVLLCTINQETKSLHEIRSIQVSYEMSSFPNKDTMLLWNRKGRKTNTYKIWRYTIENRYVVFDFNEKELVSVRANNRHMFLFTKDKILQMWCLETGKFIKDLSRNDMGIFFSKKFQVTEKKLVYIGSDLCLHILNYDFIPK